jgi:hypothetical protein
MGRKAIPIEPYMDKLVQAVALGATYEMAAMYAGLGSKTFQRWRQRAATARAGTPLPRLRERLTEAEGRAAIGWLAKIEAAANDGDWRAAAFKLQHRWPEAYGNRARVDLTVEMRRVAEKVGAELGVSADAILAEAHQFLRELDAER